MKGFTLIELIIYIALTGMILIVVSNFAFGIIEDSTITSAYLEVQQNGRLIIDKISQTVKNATAIQSLTANTLVLSMEETALNPTTLSLDNGKLQVTQGMDSPYYLSTDNINITNLNFTNLSYVDTPGTVGIEITVETNNLSGRPEYDSSIDLKTTATLNPYQPAVILSGILDPNNNYTTTLRRSAGCTANYRCVSDTDNLTYVYARSGDGERRDLYNTTDPAPTISQTTEIIKVTTRFYGGRSTSNGFGQGWTIIKNGSTGSEFDGVKTNLIYQSTPGLGQWVATEYALNPATGQAWTWTEITNLIVGVGLSSTSANSWASEVEVIVEYRF